jgi:methylthioribose-1-phosphate isomerase
MLVNHQHFRTIWPNSRVDARSVSIIDQTLLPHQFEIIEISSTAQMIHAIKTMQVRGAPLIGAAAAYGLALATLESADMVFLQNAAKRLLESRPTAVNLAWALERMCLKLSGVTETMRVEVAWAEASRICDEDVKLNQNIALHGLSVIQSLRDALNFEASRTVNILTHCNAGWLPWM